MTRIAPAPIYMSVSFVCPTLDEGETVHASKAIGMRGKAGVRALANLRQKSTSAAKMAPTP